MVSLVEEQQRWIEQEFQLDQEAATERDAPAARRKPPIAIPSRDALAITADELSAAHLTPRCIVENYLWCDLAQLVAMGGTGKTTLILYEAIHIVLGRTIWGLEVRTSGWILIVTAEDQRERLVARLRDMMEALELSEDERAIIMAAVLIWDVSGDALKLIRSADGNIDLSPEVDRIVKAFADEPPIMVIFDPLVSFGVSEQQVNDNEQGLVMAGRRLMKGLRCCVRFVHHTGKSGRELIDPKLIDQYAGRGGSALADGTRMTAVMATMGADAVPDDFRAGDGETVIALVRPKLSYAPPQPTIFLRRKSFAFDFHTAIPKSAEDRVGERKARLMTWLDEGMHARPPRHLTQREIEDGFLGDVNLTRSQFREALARLKSDGLVADLDLPKEKQKGQRRTFIAPTASAQSPSF